MRTWDSSDSLSSRFHQRVRHEHDLPPYTSAHTYCRASHVNVWCSGPGYRCLHRIPGSKHGTCGLNSSREVCGAFLPAIGRGHSPRVPAIRLPLYVLAKFALGLVSALFIGFSFFNSNLTQQDTQNVIFSIFLVSTIFSGLVQSIVPLFVTQRLLYEVRERPSKAYSSKAFRFANIVVEIPYQTFTAILVFACLYYPVIGVQSSERQGLVLLFTIEFFIYASSFAHLLIDALPDARTAGSVATGLFAITLVFNGVMQPPNALPGF
jgi:ABC-type multidrug transport system permease subunit